MRIPVFARGSNPAIDRPLQRKSESYGAGEVEAGRADWVNPDDRSQGILCRAFLYSGELPKPAQPEQLRRLFRNSLPAREVAVRFDDPRKSLETRAERRCLVVRAEAFARLCDFEVSA
ncbi:MAG TPA: hypothetical protein VFF58_00575 [Candidatus Nitrosotalea sp.]|nr:hypothetical protein [Candidatus Nitrosotalea sp.]